MECNLVEGPKTEPVSVEQQKKHTRVPGTQEDSQILNMIRAAREDFEDYCERAIIEQTWRMTMDTGFPPVIYTPKGRLIEVVSIKYQDGDDIEQTLDPLEYNFDTNDRRGRIWPVSEWPRVTPGFNSITIDFKAGYGKVTDVPKGVISYILNTTDHLYNHRTTVTELNLKDDPTNNRYDAITRYKTDVLPP